jgi:hypothetical protein
MIVLIESMYKEMFGLLEPGVCEFLHKNSLLQIEKMRMILTKNKTHLLLLET